jgi:hypothetical protein
MKELQPIPPQRPSLTAMDGALSLIVILLITQMWLLTAALESFLAGHHETALPAAIISGLLFAGCLGLYLFVQRLDTSSRKGSPEESRGLESGASTNSMKNGFT